MKFQELQEAGALEQRPPDLDQLPQGQLPQGQRPQEARALEQRPPDLGQLPQGQRLQDAKDKWNRAPGAAAPGAEAPVYSSGGKSKWLA